MSTTTSLANSQQHRATPLHKIKKDVKGFDEPETFEQRLADFKHHWPNASQRFSDARAWNNGLQHDRRVARISSSVSFEKVEE